MRNDVAQATNRQSRRLEAVQAPVIPIVGRWTAETPGTISLGQGVVSYEPPAEAIAAARRFGGKLTDHRYGPVEGLPELVAAIEAKLARENHIVVRPKSRVLVTAGGNQAFMNAVLAITDPGDEIVLLVPYYFNHEMAVVMAGAKAVAVPTTSEYQIDLPAIADAITPRTRAVVTVSPNNPTGAVYPEADLRAVNALCRDRGIFHIHDEAYEYFTYGDVQPLLAGEPAGRGRPHDLALLAVEGLRHGELAGRLHGDPGSAARGGQQDSGHDPRFVRPPSRSTPRSPRSRSAARSPARTSARSTRRAGRSSRRLSSPDVPCDVPSPDGAFYYLVRVHSALDSMTLAERLIREHRVATIPGSAFADPSPCSVRISYGALDSESVIEGLRRLVGGLRALA